MPEPPKPRGAAALIDGNSEEEQKQREQRAIRLVRSRAKRIAATELEARSALEQLTVMLHAAGEQDSVSAGSSTANILYALRPGAQVSQPQMPPLKASELENGDMDAKLSSSAIFVEAATPAGRKTPAKASAFGEIATVRSLVSIPRPLDPPSCRTRDCYDPALLPAALPASRLP